MIFVIVHWVFVSIIYIFHNTDDREIQNSNVVAMFATFCISDFRVFLMNMQQGMATLSQCSHALLHVQHIITYHKTNGELPRPFVLFSHTLPKQPLKMVWAFTNNSSYWTEIESIIKLILSNCCVFKCSFFVSLSQPIIFLNFYICPFCHCATGSKTS